MTAARDPAGLTIEPISSARIDGFHAALDSVSRERRYLSLTEAPDLEATTAFVLSLIARGNPQFVALDGDRVVGWCDIQRYERPVHAHRGLLGMGIIDGYRDRGLGRRLIEATLAAARQSGLARIELHVHADNLRAIRLYRSVGFVEEGVARNAVRIDGRSIDAVQMALLF